MPEISFELPTAMFRVGAWLLLAVTGSADQNRQTTGTKNTAMTKNQIISGRPSFQ
jgi:hypothetical protein